MSGPYKLNTNMLNKFSDDIAKIYENTILVNEVSQKFVDEVQDAITDNELPFQNIFGDKLRFVVPLQTDPVIFDILDAVSKIKNFAGVDLKSGEVIRKIKLDPKYGGGEKDQTVNIGRAINTLEITEEKKKRFLNFLARYKEALAEETEFSVVISRSPLDVLRMGEIGNTGHCHQQGNSYFKCAIQEAKTGGGIAFIVKTEDIKKLSEEELQYDEIFTDSNRDIDGISAIARLRIRKYNIYKDDSDDMESELAIPEITTYGSVKPNFYDTVLNFLKGKQPEMNNLNDVLRKYQNGDIGKAGGSYSDTSDYELFNRAFGGNDFPIVSLSSVDLDTEENPDYSDIDDADNIEAQADALEIELGQIQDRHSFTSENANFGYQVDITEDVYYNAWASIKFEDIPLGFSADEVDVGTLKSYDPEGQYGWQRSLPYSLRSTPELALKLKEALVRVANNSGIDWYDIKHVTFDDSDDTVVLVLNDENMDDASDYDTMLDNLESIDDNYDEIRDALIKALGVYGLLANGNVEAYDEIVDKYNFDETLSNTEYDADDDTLTIKVPNFGKYNEVIWEADYSNQIGEAIENYLEKYYKAPQPKDLNQMTFDKFFESYKNLNIKKLYNIESISCTLYGDRIGGIVDADIKIKFFVFNKNASDISKFIDNHVDDIKNIMRLIYLKQHEKDRTPEYKKLYGVYGRLTHFN